MFGSVLAAMRHMTNAGCSQKRIPGSSGKCMCGSRGGMRSIIKSKIVDGQWGIKEVDLSGALPFFLHYYTSLSLITPSPYLVPTLPAVMSQGFFRVKL